MYLKRSVYERLIKWKENGTHSTLEVSGARQVGKTYLINKFADEYFAHKIYINLFELSGKADKLLYLKGDTQGGTDKNIETVPIYMLERYRF